jgi:hypothetical protein
VLHALSSNEVLSNSSSLVSPSDSLTVTHY